MRNYGCFGFDLTPEGYTHWVAQHCDDNAGIGAGTGECETFCVQQLIDSNPHPLALPEAPVTTGLGMCVVLLLILRKIQGDRSKRGKKESKRNAEFRYTFDSEA